MYKKLFILGLVFALSICSITVYADNIVVKPRGETTFIMQSPELSHPYIDGDYNRYLHTCIR